MKAPLLPYLVVFVMLSAYAKAGTAKTARRHHPAGARTTGGPSAHRNSAAVNSHVGLTGAAAASVKTGARQTALLAKSALSAKDSSKKAGRRRVAALDSVTELLRLKMYLDPYDYDDIAIGFNSGATSTYNYNNDSKYLPGVNAAEGLASYSSDGVALSINFLPLPELIPDVIRLEIQAQQSWQFTMMRTELDPLPQIYQLWLVDNFKKDSIDLRSDSAYVFNVNLSDTATYGSYRFKVVVSEDPALMVHLVNFNATKDNESAQVTWETENEANYTTFAVERSTDGGKTFTQLETITSTGAGSYAYTDQTPPQVSDIYRLQLTDLNGTITYSTPVTLMFGNSANTTLSSNISLYPNPTTSVINIQINPDSGPAASAAPVTETPQTVMAVRAATVQTTASTLYNIKIVNTAGTIIKTASSSSPTWQDNVAALSPGTYIITIVDSNNKPVGHSTFVKL